MKQEQEQQVWQRVLARHQTMAQENLRGSLEITRMLTEIYRQQAEKSTGERGRLARKMVQEERKHLLCLQGMLALTGGPEEKNPKTAAVPEGKRRLAWCYHQSRALAEEYTARSGEGELGLVFQLLARREQEQCFRLARLLGMEAGEQGYSSSIR